MRTIIGNKYIDEDEVLKKILEKNEELFKDIFRKNTTYVQEYHLCRHLARELFCRTNISVIVEKVSNGDNISFEDYQLLAMQSSISENKCNEIKHYVSLRLFNGDKRKSIVDHIYYKMVDEPKILNLEGLSIYDIFFD